jgi:hypothetical protein
MDIKDYDICHFVGKIKAIQEKDFGSFGISEGSIQEAAKSLLPEGFDPSQNIDVLPVVFNLAVVNEFNKNGDGINTETAMAIVKRFINKPINIEHKKDKIVGHIINASFSEKEFDFKHYNTDSYAGKKEPFYINAAGLIYKHIYPKLAEALMQASDASTEEFQSISTSWELAFKDYKVFYGSNRLDECSMASGIEFDVMKTCLKGFGGEGVTPNGKPVNRLITGQVYPLGAALTKNPAARVSGVYLAEDMEDDMEEGEDDMCDCQDPNCECDQEDAKLKNKNAINNKIVEKNSTNAENNVRSEKFKNIFNMDKEQFEGLMSKVAESVASVVKQDAEAKSIGEIMRDALAEHSEAWKSKLAQEAEAKAKVESDLAELQSSFEATKLQLDKISQEVSAKAAVDLFNSRMNFLDDQYDFSAQELELVTAEVMSVESTEEAFEAYKGKLSIIFAHKLKSTIAAQEAEVKARIEEAIAKRLDVSKASEETEDSEEDELEIEEEEEVSIPNNNAQASTRTSLVERLKSNFSVEVTN